jgi:hypothetical protein
LLIVPSSASSAVAVAMSALSALTLVKSVKLEIVTVSVSSIAIDTSALSNVIPVFSSGLFVIVPFNTVDC